MNGSKTDIDFLQNTTLDFGIDFPLANYGKAEYRYTDFDGKLARQGATVGVGLRF
jgi:opacity protein-like surface antigen